MASPSQENLAKLGRVNDKTVMIGFSAGRPHPLVVRAMKLARNRHAATIAIADATLSEVAKLADHRLYYSSNSPAFVRSHSALLGLIHGYLNGTGMGLSVQAIIAALGLVSAVFVLVALVAAFVVPLRAHWARIAVRVGGSWIAASGLLMLGWSMRGS